MFDRIDDHTTQVTERFVPAASEKENFLIEQQYFYIDMKYKHLL